MNDEKAGTGDKKNLDDKSVGARRRRQEASLFLQRDACRHGTHAPVLPARMKARWTHAHVAVTVTATTRETSAREEGRHANNNERGEPRRRDVSIGEADD
jgi:hypothetical protein